MSLVVRCPLLRGVVFHYYLPFHGLVGVLVKPASNSFFSSPAYFTNSLSSLNDAVTFISSKPGEEPACSPVIITNKHTDYYYTAMVLYNVHNNSVLNTCTLNTV